MIRRKGMTLIEILMTVAILGLLIAVLILLLDPGDDRRCRLEAERFAAWLIGAESEAVMRDGPVRAAVEFSEQSAVRELAQVGADITAQAWQADDKADKFKVKKPVRLTTVDTPLAGELTDGQAWILFNGPRTAGAVTVFQLGEAVYSVVVPPRGAGEIEVKKGRAGLPAPPEFQRAPGTLPSLLTGLGFGGDGLGAMPVPPRPTDPADPRPPPGDGLDLDAGVPPVDPDDGVPPPPVDASVGTDPPPPA
ncbi:MAG: prepilin-type N-terminal cleavage/methylation domain-containing protein, partial [Myxococcales bacterium]|nr:prepilin-type N-terminal cleavage/methylation domain-containing protein [Myxococcales bacterium]